MSTIEEDISPIGSTVTAAIRERMERSSEYKAKWDAMAGPREIARQIVHYRTRTGLSQQELAQRIGTSYSQISRIESGRHKTNIHTLQRIADPLGLRLVVTFMPADSADREDAAAETARPAASNKRLA